MPKSNKKLTPAMAQYARMKDQYPDAILFFRMGDFFELFGNDAVQAAPLRSRPAVTVMLRPVALRLREGRGDGGQP